MRALSQRHFLTIPPKRHTFHKHELLGLYHNKCMFWNTARL